MTRQRDLKRRARERQARTGESYVTARRRVLAARPGGAAAVPVVEVQDVSAEAARLGFRCEIAMLSELCERAEPAIVLAGLRDALVQDRGNPAAVRLFGVAFGLPSPASPRSEPPHQVARRPYAERAVADMLVFRVDGRSPETRGGDGSAAGPEAETLHGVDGHPGVARVLCVLYGKGLMLRLIDWTMENQLLRIVALQADGPRRMAAELASVRRQRAAEPPELAPPPALEAGDTVSVVTGPFASYSGMVDRVDLERERVTVSLARRGQATLVELRIRHVVKIAPVAVLVYGDRRYRVTTGPFVIGRAWSSNLVLLDSEVSRRHAVVTRRNGSYYLTDLGSASGIEYKGMRIDNKRIDEGDVFLIGRHELRFTYRGEH